MQFISFKVSNYGESIFKEIGSPKSTIASEKYEKQFPVISGPPKNKFQTEYNISTISS
jgi:hypothetical protein